MPNNKTILFSAVSLATRAHTGQCRRGSDFPYIIHPLSVGKVLSEHGCGREVVAAGILHDVVEDTGTPLSEIRRICGAKVASLVDALSEPDRKAPWEKRKQDTLKRYEKAPAAVLLIACADKIDNLRSLLREHGDDLTSAWRLLHRGKAKQRWYYGSLLAVMRRRLKTGVGKKLADLLACEMEIVFR